MRFTACAPKFPFLSSTWPCGRRRRFFAPASPGKITNVSEVREILQAGCCTVCAVGSSCQHLDAGDPIFCRHVFTFHSGLIERFAWRHNDSPQAGSHVHGLRSTSRMRGVPDQNNGSLLCNWQTLLYFFTNFYVSDYAFLTSKHFYISFTNFYLFDHTFLTSKHFYISLQTFIYFCSHFTKRNIVMIAFTGESHCIIAMWLMLRTLSNIF